VAARGAGEQVEVGTDADGDTVTSCVIVPSESSPLRETKRLCARYELARRCLADLIAEQGKPAPSPWGLPHDVRAVSVDAWREKLTFDGVLDGQDADVRKRFWDLKSALKVRSVVGERDRLAWLA